jgi:glycerol uptake facilitator-like aquaporin
VIVSLITFLAWENSSAHFNSAITIAAYLFHYEKWRENLKSLFAILAA